MLRLIKQLQNMNLSPEKSFFMILTVNYLVHEIGFITDKLIIAEHVKKKKKNKIPNIVWF